MIYTTLKANQEAGNDYLDIVIYTDECWTSVALLFDDCKYGDEDNTDLDKLLEDYTERQIASVCLKWLREYAKEKESCLLNWTTGKCFLDLDGDGEIAFEQIEKLIAGGVITNARQLNDIENKAGKKGHSIKNIEDLIEEHFPCYADEHETFCNNCGNCC